MSVIVVSRWLRSSVTARAASRAITAFMMSSCSRETLRRPSVLRAHWRRYREKCSDSWRQNAMSDGDPQAAYNDLWNATFRASHSASRSPLSVKIDRFDSAWNRATTIASHVSSPFSTDSRMASASSSNSVWAMSIISSRDTGATLNPLWSVRTTSPSATRRMSASRSGLRPDW